MCDSVLGTLLNIGGKKKDNIYTRLDLKELGMREELYPIEMDDKLVLPSACYTMSSEEKLKLCEFLKGVKIPDNFAYNISRRVNLKERKITSFKSHDSHILMQRLLPLAIRNLLPKNVCEVLIELSEFFKEICSKVLRVENLDSLEKKIALTLCKLERLFPPAFFDVMVHLLVHLPSEAKIGGPVNYRWMYPLERLVWFFVISLFITYTLMKIM